MTNENNYCPNLILGAGPAGLAIAGRLRKMGLPFEILEKTDKVGWAWHNHYDRLHLHTVNQYSHLPHLPFPDDFPLYVPRLRLVEYLEQYARHFNIKPHFNAEADSIKKEDGRWKVRCKNGESFTADRVILATGINRVPNVPHWEGEAQFKGKIVHSRYYKNPEPFLKQKVLVVGMGNTGAEVALDLCEHGCDTYISVRSPLVIVPRDVNGRPVQVTAKQLEKLPFGLGAWLGSLVRKIVIGNLSKYGVPLSKNDPTRQLKETGKTPVIDIGTVARIKAGEIKVVKDVKSFYAEGVEFKDGRKEAFDSVILATGYHAQIADFLETTEGLLDRYNLPKSPVGEGPYKGLYFVGFDNYKLGGILGTINSDSEAVAADIHALSVVPG